MQDMFHVAKHDGEPRSPVRLLYSGNGDDHVHSVPEQPGTIAGRHGKSARRLAHTAENLPRLNHIIKALFGHFMIVMMLYKLMF